MMKRKDKKSLRQRLQDAMSTPNGQIVMNYAYNWGASVVIMGTLFKLTHLPGANFMLFAGMGTEVLIFFLSAFDLSGVRRKKDKEEEVETGNSTMPAGTPVAANGEGVAAQQTGTLGDQPVAAGPVVAGQGQGGVSGGPAVVFIQSGGNSAGADAGFQPAGQMQASTVQSPVMPQPVMSQPFVQQPIPTVSPAVNEEMEEATTAYLEQLKSMTEILSRCTSKAETFSQDADQLANLSRTLSGINALYEMQLRTVSTQIGTIDQVHEQTRKMARQIEELNEVYARMLQAMTSRQV